VRRVSPTPLKPELEPDEQSLAVVTSLWSTALGWFRGGNTIVRIGVLVLLVGVVLLLRLASHYFDTPIELRLSLVALGGLGLAAFGLKLRESRRGYGLSLQGAGLATLYLTLFAAYRLYALLPSGLTFALLAVLASVTAVLAVRQDALPLALLAFGGAFASPILTSNGSGDVVALFSYYLLLNAALAWIAHYRTWRVLNLLGVLFTFGVAGAWGLQQFNPALRWPLEALLLAHVALYLFIVVRYSQQLVRAASDQPTLRVPLVDSGLLFGVPLMAFGLQAGLFQGMPYALAVFGLGVTAGLECAVDVGRLGDSRRGFGLDGAASGAWLASRVWAVVAGVECGGDGLGVVFALWYAVAVGAGVVGVECVGVGGVFASCHHRPAPCVVLGGVAGGTADHGVVVGTM
jgi:uncharacterized membrane protein